MTGIPSAVAQVMDARPASIDSQIQTSVYSKQLQAQKQAGAAVVKLLASAAQLSKEAGKGQSFDAVG